MSALSMRVLGLAVSNVRHGARNSPLRVGAAAVRNALIIVLAVGSIAIGSTVHAAEPPPQTSASTTRHGPEWESLSPEQQAVLENWRARWGELPPERRAALVRGADRWLAMSPEKREQVRQRFERWRALSAEERRELRNRHREFQELPHKRQRRIRDNYRRFRDLPAEQREELRKRWLSLSPEERKQVREQLRRERRNREGQAAPAHEER